jgi:serine/threonine protein kinase
VVGTKLYAVPEIEKGLPHDSKVDIYSLGIR